MDAWVSLLSKDLVVVVEAMALFVVGIGTIEAFLAIIQSVLPSSAGSRRLQDICLRYGHWLVAGLTFQLAADIIRTSSAPTWRELGQVGAIAVLRTFLNYFLERDLTDLGSDRNR